MAKIAVFVPRDYMLEQVTRIAEEEKLNLLTAKVIDNSEAVEQARQAIEQGAQIVVARGLHALAIQKYTKVPVVEIVLTGQELGLLVTKAKKMVGHPHPSIALIGYRNLLSDVSHFNEIFDIDLTAYYVDDPAEVEGYVSEAISHHPDVVIGGDLVGHSMEKYTTPYMFFNSMEDSIRNALQIAGKMAYTADVEQLSNAQFATVTDTMLQGVIKINMEHRITAVNRTAEEYLKANAAKLVGRELEGELKDVDASGIDAVLSGQRDVYSTTLRVHGLPLRYIIAPIQYDNRIVGAILSFSRLNGRQPQTEAQIKKGYLQGYVAAMNFSDMKTDDRQMKACIALGKQYAASGFPVLIRDEMGYNKEKMAQCIHNNSSRQSMPFIAVNLSGLDAQEQMIMLFGGFGADGTQGLVEQSNLGTLFINEIENLSPFCQYQIYRLVRHKPIICGAELKTRILDVRLIAGTRRDLSAMAADGSFRSDLYYAIAGLSMELVPVRKRREDIIQLVNGFLQDFCVRNSCYLTLTDEAMKVIADYPWSGNEIQLENFCERLFLTTRKKAIDEGRVRHLLITLYPERQEIKEEKTTIIYQAPEARDILRLLEECGGNRRIAAERLGISTTTLWRRMKKYGIVV